jgi:hypothetical protein
MVPPDDPNLSSQGSGSLEDTLAEGLLARMVGLIRSLDRQDQLETSEEYAGWLDEFSKDPEAARAAAKEMALRAFCAVSDSVNYQLLQLAAGQDGRPVSDFSRALGIGRVETVERIHDLIQVGALSALSELVESLADRTAEELSKRLSERLS